jgi:hypothetical protein
VWTAFTIVPIAGKLATSLSLIPVPIEPKTICLQIDADPRLAAAAGGAARYFADAAGLENNAVSQFQAATISACTQAFENLAPGDPSLEVTVSHFSDRIEVAISHQGEASPAVGLDAIAGLAAQMGGGASGLAGVDRVQFDMQGQHAVTRLTKYLGTARVDL